MKANVLRKVRGFITENRLFMHGEKVLAAVSGGADSVALLDILISLEDLRLDLAVVHLNHGLRGADSDADEEFVRCLAKKYGLPFFSRKRDVGMIAREEARSLEDAGRIARYLFFDEVAASYGARVVVLAHHADDQAETVLMRLLRGSAGTGLCAMSPCTAGRYVRPLLCLSRDEIDVYLKERRLEWRDDKSNESMDFLRNRIRHELIPILSGYNPAISKRLAATAESLSADEEVLEALTDSAYSRHFIDEDEEVSLSVSGIRTEPRGIRFRLYRRAIGETKGDLSRISYLHLRSIDRLVFSASPNCALTLPDGASATRSYGKILFKSSREEAPPIGAELTINGPGIYQLPGGGIISVQYVAPSFDVRSAPPTVGFFDGKKAPFPWEVRTFRPGERISPMGMAGNKKVKELFIEGKVPLQERSHVPLLFKGDTLLWVAGLKRSGKALIGPDTGEIVMAELMARP